MCTRASMRFAAEKIKFKMAEQLAIRENLQITRECLTGKSINTRWEIIIKV